MFAVPFATPVTIPAEPTVATLVFELSHIPPVVVHNRGDGIPEHIVVAPVMGAGIGSTVTVAVTVLLAHT